MAKARLQIKISGRVQGVFFRKSACDEAERMGVCGYVRNLINGDVEIVCEGEEVSLSQFLGWCRQGPPMARVTKVDTKKLPATGEYKHFFVE